MCFSGYQVQLVCQKYLRQHGRCRQDCKGLHPLDSEKHLLLKVEQEGSLMPKVGRLDQFHLNLILLHTSGNLKTLGIVSIKGESCPFHANYSFSHDKDIQGIFRSLPYLNINNRQDEGLKSTDFPTQTHPLIIEKVSSLLMLLDAIPCII